MATTRVYILAKELGVDSKAIVKKCQDEGLDVKNHMATISAGLAATIREWFSEGDNLTTEETAERVDLEKVRVKRKSRKKIQTKETEESEQEIQVTTAEPAAEEITAQETTETVEPEVVAETPVETESTAEEQVIETKPEPKPIIPAGPMLEKPEPAKLSGPQVVRIEKPEPETRPRPKFKPKSRYNQPATEPLIRGSKIDDKISKQIETGDKAAHSHHKTRTHGRRKDEEDESTKRAKFLTLRRERDLEERQARLSAAGGEGIRLRPTRKISSKAAAAQGSSVSRPAKAAITEPITVKSLSAAMAVKATDIIEKLLKQGIMATANQVIGADVAELVALELGTELTIERKKLIEDQIKEEFENRERKNLKKRSVVVTVLGHVDHGKTSLLDKIRTTDVQSGEAGGITQHIGASQVSWNGHTVTFLDTPGHEAFTLMRARGANMTDVVVLVVAADDGVMPQTVEAISHAKAAKVPVIVALNKIDLPGYDINRIYSELSEHGLTPAEWSGDTEIVKTSAVTGQGIDDLLEHLDYVAQLLDLKADDTIPATGWVIEAKMSSQRGPVASLLIKEGKLNKGDIVLAGNAYGRIKMIRDSNGRSIKTATSSMPVEVIGLNNVPGAGDRFYCLSDINLAKSAADEIISRTRETALAKRTQVTLDNLFSQIEAGNVKELNVIIKADVQGSVDTLTKYLSELSTAEVKIKILHAAVGGINEGDVVLAEASNAVIIGFNVIAEGHISKIAEEVGVDIRLYNIIYRITEDLQKSMVGMLEPEEKEKSLGRATVRDVFKVSKVGSIAGCYVSDGVAAKNAKVRLIRDNIVIRNDLTIASLKHFKDDAREVRAGLECGIKLTKFDDIKVNDVFDFYEIVKIARTL